MVPVVHRTAKFCTKNSTRMSQSSYQSDKDLTVESVANVAECQTNVPVWDIFDANMNLIFETFVVAFFLSPSASVAAF